MGLGKGLTGVALDDEGVVFLCFFFVFVFLLVVLFLAPIYVFLAQLAETAVYCLNPTAFWTSRGHKCQSTVLPGTHDINLWSHPSINPSTQYETPPKEGHIYCP